MPFVHDTGGRHRPFATLRQNQNANANESAVSRMRQRALVRYKQQGSGARSGAPGDSKR
jgi:hypothetical protein